MLTLCNHLCCRCLSPDCQMGGLGCDNMTCVIVCFLHDQPYQSLVDRCAKITRGRELRDNSAGETESDEDEAAAPAQQTENIDIT